MFGFQKKSESEHLLGGILDAMDTGVVVARGSRCRILYMNSAARSKMDEHQLDTRSCSAGYGSMFPSLCDRCPNGRDAEEEEASEAFDMQDEAGNDYAVTAGTITWLDKNPAVLLTVRDVTQERSMERRLYQLAYMDHLTGVPNRQKLKEEFLKLENRESELYGAVAMFDMDNFKLVNDTYGHNTGDIMLRRLTEHLSLNPEYAGHLYRLGGDEFVLFYMEEKSRFESEDEMRLYFKELLQGAFFSYTMPNIELSCTISMGISFFPEHGITSSELLRKADIALYQAKESGRNKMVLFEDRYDSAKKFDDYYINIQPILTTDGQTFGYELTDSGRQEAKEELFLGEINRAIDALGLGDFENSARYFLTYSNSLTNRTVFKNLQKDKFVIQVRAGKKSAEHDPDVFRAMQEEGYEIALAGLRPDNLRRELLDCATYVKFAPEGVTDAEQKKIIADWTGKIFIASGVDTQKAFERARRLGFGLYQGHYFNQPVVVKKEKVIDPLRSNYLQLISLTSTNDYVDFGRIADVISSDVALSYRLLRLLNSAAVGLRNRMSSIAMAVSYLGEESLKKWIALLALRGVASEKPLELIRVSLIRARFGEQLAPHLKPPRDPRQVFMTGMFSLLHIALDKTQEELFEEISMSEEIRESLTTDDGIYSPLIAFFGHYEYSNWDEVTRFCRENGLSSEMVYNAYITAVRWYNDLADE